MTMTTTTEQTERAKQRLQRLDGMALMAEMTRLCRQPLLTAEQEATVALIAAELKRREAAARAA